MAKITPKSSKSIFTDEVLSVLPKNNAIKKGVANLVNATDPEWKKAQQIGIKKTSQSDEWKANQLEGTRTKRANNVNWQKNVVAGATKREQNMGKERRTELNRTIMASEKWKNAHAESMKDRWTNEENLTTCPHCGKKVDNANYKRWHGDNCKHKS